MINQTQCLAEYSVIHLLDLFKENASAVFDSAHHSFIWEYFLNGTFMDTLWKKETFNKATLEMETQSGMKQTYAQRGQFEKLVKNLMKQWFYDWEKQIRKAPRVHPELFQPPPRWNDDPAILAWFGLAVNTFGYATETMNLQQENEWHRACMDLKSLFQRVNNTAKNEYDNVTQNLVQYKLGLNQYVNLFEISTLGCMTKIIAKSTVLKLIMQLLPMAEARNDTTEINNLKALPSQASLDQLIAASELLVVFNKHDMIDSSLLDFPESWYKQQKIKKQKKTNTKSQAHTITNKSSRKSTNKYDATSDDEDYESTVLNHQNQTMTLVENHERKPFVTPLMLHSIKKIKSKSKKGTETKESISHTITSCDWLGVLCNSFEPLMSRAIEQFNDYFEDLGVTKQHWILIGQYVRNGYINNGIRCIDYENELLPNLVNAQREHVNLAKFDTNAYRQILMSLFFLIFKNLPQFIKNFWPKSLQSQYKTDSSCKPEIDEINWISVITYANIWMSFSVEDSETLTKIMNRDIGPLMTGLNTWLHFIQLRKLQTFPNHKCNEVCTLVFVCMFVKPHTKYVC